MAAGMFDSPNDDEPLSARAARELLRQLQLTRRMVRSDPRGAAIPLFVFSLTVLLSAVLAAVHGLRAAAYNAAMIEAASMNAVLVFPPPAWIDSFAYQFEFWAWSGPATLIMAGVLLARRSRRVGAGPGARIWLAAAAAVVLVLRLGPRLLDPWLGDNLLTNVLGYSWSSPGSVTAAALLVIAWRHHDRLLAAWSIILGVVLGLVAFQVVGNMLRTIFYVNGSDLAHWDIDWDTAALTVLGIGLLAAGVACRGPAPQDAP